MKLKRCLISFITTLFFVTTLGGVSVFATEATINSTSQEVSIAPYAEEAQWIYQMVDGKLQKRLWSLSHNKWLTEWEWC